VGMGAKSDTVNFNALEIAHFARTLTGCMYGASDPVRDVPLLLEHVRAGRLDLGALVSARIGLDGVAAAFADLEAGRGARSLIVFDGERN
jgi:S-(hydroxymethyl)glutathione dehydrogenase / alcohol dehydrogenase